MKNEIDEHLPEVLKMVENNEKVSSAVLQRKFYIGYVRASKIMDQFHEAKKMKKPKQTKPKEVKTHRCPKCGATLLTNGKHEWCTRVPGPTGSGAKGCDYGIRGSKLLGEKIQCSVKQTEPPAIPLDELIEWLFEIHEYKRKYWLTKGIKNAGVCIKYKATIMALQELKERREKEKDELLSRDEMNRTLDMSVFELDLSVRSSNCMYHAGISTIRELTAHAEQSLLKYRQFGKKSLQEVKAKLEQKGLRLKTWSEHFKEWQEKNK